MGRYGSFASQELSTSRYDQNAHLIHDFTQSSELSPSPRLSQKIKQKKESIGEVIKLP